MSEHPARIGDLDLVDRGEVVAFLAHRDGQPARPIRRLDTIASATVSPCELHRVEEDEDVATGDDGEIASPRDVARLDDGDAARHDGETLRPKKLCISVTTRSTSASLSSRYSGRRTNR